MMLLLYYWLSLKKNFNLQHSLFSLSKGKLPFCFAIVMQTYPYVEMERKRLIFQ